MLTLAIPVVFVQLGFMAMGLVDTLMVGACQRARARSRGVRKSLFL